MIRKRLSDTEALVVDEQMWKRGRYTDRGAERRGGGVDKFDWFGCQTRYKIHCAGKEGAPQRQVKRHELWYK
jgi:hypothetical protein